ncbi:hypothetical protein D9615_010034 [Tricholomella constricta]|uniref:alpha-L-rhamnosidase n=1 Tax=Tricholomella constricta TaxID=117010 RepID=A0A8H5GU36_9AGAR|nr:hypothetical protein D9615_010034 [Tricholomella constricta]
MLQEDKSELERKLFGPLGVKARTLDDLFLTKELLHNLLSITNRYWYEWIRQSTYTGSWKEAVHRSALALKLLIFESPLVPSLPAQHSRFPTLSAARATGTTGRHGFTQEANAYMEFIFERLPNKNPDGSLQIMYTIHGGKDLEEIELTHLDGHKGSKPVRIGNGAADHVQLWEDSHVCLDPYDCHDQFTLYVNGILVGASPTSQDIWKSLQRFSVPHNAGSNLFAVRATNLADVSSGGNGPAGLLDSIQITFSDGMTTIISSDSSWRSIKTVPANFQLPSLDDSSWAAATVVSQYGSGPWGMNVALPSGDPRAFRKTFQTPSGKILKSAFIILTIDDGFTLYVNGALVGSSPKQIDIWKSAQQFTVPLSGSSATVFAVKADNLADVASGGPSPAGLLAAIQVIYTDGSSTDSSFPRRMTHLGARQHLLATAIGEHPAPLLRKEFSVSKTISFARLYYAVGGYASITINGNPASDHVLTPGFTKYDTQTEYVVIDVASKLRNNAIGVELGRSHYAVTQGNMWNWNNAWRAEPTLRTVLSIGYTVGTTAHVVSDGSWQVIEGPTRLDDVFGGENYDASYLKPGFDSPGFVTTGWVNAEVVTGPKGVLVRQRELPSRVVQSMKPVSITQPVQGIYLAAFERVVAGWAKITVTGPAKTLITIHFGEKLKSDGTVIFEDSSHYYANNFQTDRFWLAGTGAPEVFEPKFSYKGYQYMQLEGWPGTSAPTADDIVGQVAVVYTMLNNVHSIPEDCPTFEKSGWSGDAMLGAEMFLTNLDAKDLLAKYVRDLAESRPNGSGLMPTGLHLVFNFPLYANSLMSSLNARTYWKYDSEDRANTFHESRDRDRNTLHLTTLKSGVNVHVHLGPDKRHDTEVGDQGSYMSPMAD